MLGVKPGAAPPEIEAAFRRHAWAAHPDRGGDERRFAELAEARLLLVANAPTAGHPRGTGTTAAGAGTPDRPRAPRRPSPVEFVSDANMMRARLEHSVRRWVGRRRPGAHRRVL